MTVGSIVLFVSLELDGEVAIRSGDVAVVARGADACPSAAAVAAELGRLAGGLPGRSAPDRAQVEGEAAGIRVRLHRAERRGCLSPRLFARNRPLLPARSDVRVCDTPGGMRRHAHVRVRRGHTLPGQLHMLDARERDRMHGTADPRRLTTAGGASVAIMVRA